MATPRHKKCKANRKVPVETTLITDTTIPPPQTRISKPLRELDVNVPTPSQRAPGSERLSPGNSETQNLASPSSTLPSGFQAPPNTGIFESQFRNVPIRNVRGPLQREEVGDERRREALNAMDSRRANPERLTQRIQENFGVTHSLLHKKSPYKKPKMQVDEWGLPVGELQKAFESRIRGLTKLHLSDVHIMWPTLKKSNGLAEIMKALMRDFPGPWNYGEVVKKIGEITRRKRFEFRKAAMAGDERPIDCSTKSWVFFMKEARDHRTNPNWNAQQVNAASRRKFPQTKLGSGGKRSFAKIFVEKFGIVPSADQIARAKYVGVKNFFEEFGEDDCIRKETDTETSDDDIP